MADGSVRVWATHDGVRVNPETGRYFEDRPDIHSDYPTGDYKSGNSVWDAASGTISLHAARNEFVAFQVIVEADRPVGPVSVEFDRLTGPGGACLDGRCIALFKAWYVRVNQPSTGYERTSLGPGWYPDALLPVPEGRPLSFSLPDPDNAIGPSHRNQTLFVDVYVPRERAEAPPGAYAGVVRVSWPGGKRELKVRLTVWDFALPDETHCRGDIFNNSLQDMDPDTELRYYQMAQRHRFQPGICYYRPDLKLSGTRVTIDWSAYDRRLQKYFDGSAFTAEHGYWGPGYGVPIDHVLLPFDCGKAPQHGGAWPIAMPREGATPEFEQVWVETARQVREHFDSDPNRQRVGKVVFLNGLDEAYYDEAYEKMVYYSLLLRRGLGKGWFQYRIDGSYSRQAMDRMHPYIDLWVCHTVGFDHDTVAHFRQLGVEPWFYGPVIYESRTNSACGSNTFLDLDMLTCRGLGWAAWKHRCGYCEWEFDWAADRAWTEALNWVTEHVAYNGSGLLIYRGDVVGSRDPIPTIRLKAQRRGFQDYEYFWLLQQGGRGEDADRLVNSVVHTMPFGEAAIGNVEIWRNDPAAWDAARIEAGRLLHGEAAGR